MNVKEKKTIDFGRVNAAVIVLLSVCHVSALVADYCCCGTV